MEVTKSNFPGVLQDVRSLLSRCSLVSFDCEFTGLRGSGIREEWEDTPEERYLKLRENSSEFTLIQYGICFFVQDETTELKYEVFPFNFYLFPSYATGRKVPHRLDRCFTCQPSSLLMLATSGLDFNKWINEGVSYLRESDEDWWRERRKEKGDPTQEELNQFLGFSQVFNMIVESKTPLIGHSILLDLLHSYSHFIGTLPEALMTFKADLHKRLPSLYDTQVICDSDNIRPQLGPSLSLANVYNSVSKPPFPQITTVFPASCMHYASGKHMHEAAYDAYVSGCVFVVLARMIGGKTTTDLFEAVDMHKNRVYLFNCESTDALDMTGPETRALRNHIFHLTFSKEVTTEDIKNLFSPFGGCHVSWNNDTSARVTLHHRGKSEEALKALSGEGTMCGEPFVIAPYDNKPNSTTRQSLQPEVATEMHSSMLGKRKVQDDIQSLEEKALQSPKKPIFEENSDW